MARVKPGAGGGSEPPPLEFVPPPLPHPAKTMVKTIRPARVKEAIARLTVTKLGWVCVFDLDGGEVRLANSRAAQP